MLEGGYLNGIIQNYISTTIILYESSCIEYEPSVVSAPCEMKKSDRLWVWLWMNTAHIQIASELFSILIIYQVTFMCYL